jgi:hypothetical protein
MPEPTSGTGRPTSAELVDTARLLERDGALLDMTAADYRALARAAGELRDQMAADWLRLLAIADAIDGVRADHQEGTMTGRKKVRQWIDRVLLARAISRCRQAGHVGPGWVPYCERCGIERPGDTQW